MVTDEHHSALGDAGSNLYHSKGGGIFRQNHLLDVGCGAHPTGFRCAGNIQNEMQIVEGVGEALAALPH